MCNEQLRLKICPISDVEGKGGLYIDRILCAVNS